MTTKRVEMAIREATTSPVAGRRYVRVTVSKPFMTTTRVVLSLIADDPPNDLIRISESPLGSLLLVQGSTQYLLASGQWSDLRLTEYEEN